MVGGGCTGWSSVALFPCETRGLRMTNVLWDTYCSGQHAGRCAVRSRIDFGAVRQYQCRALDESCIDGFHRFFCCQQGANFCCLFGCTTVFFFKITKRLLYI